MTQSLRVVEPGEVVSGRKLTVSQAAADGSLKEQLVAMREQVAKAIEDPKCHPRDLAPLSRRYVDIAKELEAIKVSELEEAGAGAGTPDDEWEAV